MKPFIQLTMCVSPGPVMTCGLPSRSGFRTQACRSCSGWSATGGGHALVMVGWPGAAWHIELVGDPDDATPAAPTEEDLLVLYLGGGVKRT